MVRRLLAALLGAVVMTGPAMAQDGFNFSQQSMALTSSVIGNLSLGEVARGQTGGRSSGQAGGQAGNQAAARQAPGPRDAAARLSYASTPATQRQALEAYLARAARHDAEAARVTGAELRSRDITGEMAREMRNYGLDVNDAADVMTAFLMSGNEIINQRSATPAQAQAARRQIAAQLNGNPALRDPAARSAFAEELKITTYILAAAAGSAKRDGELDQYRQSLTTFYRRVTGENIGRWRLTDAGFAR